MKIGPSSTGDCYQAARNTLFELWLRRERGDPSIKDVRLVHGTIVPGRDDAAGKRIDHAWVELNGDTVVERSNGNDITMGKDEYCRLLQAVEDARYTLEETYREMNRANHFGPWHK
jgi:hypothetical protein